MHPDLKFNYVSHFTAFPQFFIHRNFIKTKTRRPLLLQNAEASYDFSSNDPYPYPRYTDDWFNR